jgi:hypothetical protein
MVGKLVAGAALIAGGLATGNPMRLLGGATLVVGAVAEAMTPMPRVGGSGGGRSATYVQSTIPPEIIVYGRCLVPASAVFQGRHTDQIHNEHDREYSHIVYAITRRRPLDGIEGVLLGSEIFDLEPNDGTNSNFPDDALIPAWGKYRKLFGLWFKPGADDDPQPCFPWLSLKVPGTWQSTARLTGIAACHCVFIFDPTVWPNGPPEIKFVVRGFLVNDPRAPGAPPAWSENVALCYADAMYGPHAGEGAIDPALIDTAALVAAANTCDEVLTKKDGTDVARYRIGGFGDATQDHDVLLADILQAMGGTRVRVGATYKIHAAAAVAPGAALTSADLAGPVAVKPLRDLRSLSNEVHTLYPDERNAFAENTSPTWPPPPSAANPYRDLDGGIRLVKELRQPMVPWTEQVQRLQKIWLLQHRLQVTWNADFLPTAAMLLEPVDVVPYSDDMLGWSAETFQVGSYAENEDGSYALGFVQYSAGAFAWVPEDEQTEATESGTVLILVDDDIATTKDVAVDCSPLDNDPGPGPLTISVVGAPAVAGATSEISEDDPSIVTYTPATGYVGLDSFTYDATDGVSTATASINVTVANDTGVTAIDDSYIFSDNKTHNLDVLANDLPVAATKTITAVTSPSNGGTASIHSGGGSIDYQRATGFIGIETFDYTVSGGTPTGTDTGTVGVTLRRGGGGDNPSGLPWASGFCDTGDSGSVGSEGDAWATWRGRPLDVVNFRMDRFGDLANCLAKVNSSAGQYATAFSKDIRVEQVMPMVPSGEGHAGYPTIFAAAAGGLYDAEHVAIANKIASYSRVGSTIIRLAHECGSGSQADAYVHDPSPGYRDFRVGWRRIALIYKAHIPGVLMSWNNIQRPSDPRPAYPGDDCVDIIDADCYGNNNSGFPTTQAEFLVYANHTDRNGAPGGPRAWALYARSQGKRIGYAEWAVTHLPQYGDKADNPVYIEGMWNLFNEFSDILEYECYFNGATRHFLHNYPIINPKAAAKYAALWAP